MKTMYRSSRRKIFVIILLSVWASLVAYSKISPDFQRELLIPLFTEEK